ncbi:MAG: glutamate formimidoyltransferase [Candidatus Kapaibacteriota bacterium]|jgi:glutamate formiminotransferase/formiminotetrahydrofolate cyclodeaminase
MKKKIVECVPNFSEGREESIINAIAEAIKNTEGCTLLDVDPGKSTNRTVYTFVGEPKAVVEGALNAAKVARKLIDMRKHKGEHPRIGALDVCPFVPVANVTMEECIECSKEFGRRLSEEIGVPVYLYEYAQPLEYRKKLPQIREGEYEGLAEKIKKPEWKPDFGPSEFIPEWGATVTGARFFLIAYNVNILGTKEQAHRIALNIREAGRGPDQPGLFKEVKAIGWWVEEYNMAQVSINLTNYKVAPPHLVFEEIKKQAKELRIGVAGSELVGLIPLEAILMAANYYIEKEDLFILDEDQKVKLVVDRLGLNSITKFNPKKKIIEYMIEEEANEPLANSSVREFIQKISARTPAPGGGSASAAIAAIGSALGCMVAQLTYGVRKFEHLTDDLRKVIPPLYYTTRELISMIDADANAFNEYMEAMRLPKTSPEEILTRENAMQEGLKKAIMVPLTTMRLAFQCWEALKEVARIGNISSKSDIEVGAKALETGIWGAYRNILINLPTLKDEDFKAKIIEEAEQIVEQSQQNLEDVIKIIEARKE